MVPWGRRSPQREIWHTNTCTRACMQTYTACRSAHYPTCHINTCSVKTQMEENGWTMASPDLDILISISKSQSMKTYNRPPPGRHVQTWNGKHTVLSESLYVPDAHPEYWSPGVKPHVNISATTRTEPQSRVNCSWCVNTCLWSSIMRSRHVFAVLAVDRRAAFACNKDEHCQLSEINARERQLFLSCRSWKKQPDRDKILTFHQHHQPFKWTLLPPPAPGKTS